MCISYSGSEFGIAVTDISTGKFLTTSVENGSKIIDEIYKFEPSEIIYQDGFEMSGINLEHGFRQTWNCRECEAPRHHFDF